MASVDILSTSPRQGYGARGRAQARVRNVDRVEHQLEQRLTIQAAPAAVWDFLWDIERVTACIEGCEDVVALVEGESYGAHLRRRVGPFSLRLDLAIRVVERVAPTKVVLEIEGNDKRLRSNVRQTLTVLLEQGTHPVESRVQMSAVLEIGGVLASLAKQLVAMYAAENIDQFAQALTRAVEGSAPTAGPCSPGPDLKAIRPHPAPTTEGT